MNMWVFFMLSELLTKNMSMRLRIASTNALTPLVYNGLKLSWSEM